jgi:hypothetical protein
MLSLSLSSARSVSFKHRYLLKYIGLDILPNLKFGTLDRNSDLPFTAKLQISERLIETCEQQMCMVHA